MNQRGNLSVAFLVYMNLFLILLWVLLNQGQMWVNRAASGLIAETVSIAVTEKLNAIMNRELEPEKRIEKKISEKMAQGMDREEAVAQVIRNGEIKSLIQKQAYDDIAVNDLLLEAFDYDYRHLGEQALSVVIAHEDELAQTAWDPLQGLTNPRLMLEIPSSTSDQVRVIVEADAEKRWNLPFSERWVGQRITSDAYGPGVDYLSGMPPVEFSY